MDVGSVEYAIIAFPGNQFKGEIIPAIKDLVDRDLVCILDLVFVKKELDGSITGLALADLDHDGQLDLAVFEGAQSGLLCDDDLAEAAGLAAPDSAVGILVYENIWAGPFVTAMQNAGAQVMSSGRIPVDAVIATLDDLESAKS